MNKKKKTILSIVTMFVILIGIFLAFIFYRGSPDKILSVANQFQPPTSWILESNDVTPPQTVCLSDVACPSVSRSWKTDGISKNLLNKLFEKSRWGMHVDKECAFPENATGSNIYLCSASGTVDQFRISVTAVGDSRSPHNPSLVLNVNP